MTLLPTLPVAVLTATLLIPNADSSNQTTDTELITVVQQDKAADSLDPPSARVSAGGRHVAFASYAQLLPGDTNRVRDVYVLDLLTRQLTLESLGRDQSSANGDSFAPDISGDGRYVVFVSSAGNLGDTRMPSGTPRVFLRDRERHTTRALTVNMAGRPAEGPSGSPVISADGMTIAFESAALDLVEDGTTTRTPAVYLIRLPAGVCERVSVSSAGGATMGPSVSPSVNADGRYVAFMSTADLTCRGASSCLPDTKGIPDVYLRDTLAHITRRLVARHTGDAPNEARYHPALSGDGRYVAFVSESPALPRSPRRTSQVYLYDTRTDQTELVSRSPNGRPANAASTRPTVSYDGARVAFQSLASDLLCQRKCSGVEQDTNLVWDIFLRDRRSGRTYRVSADAAEEWMESSRGASLDQTGRVIAFSSRHPRNIQDEQHDEDLYIWLVSESRILEQPR
jgi:Tol biopolymer transport system component